jgi:uncharacterized protein YciW
MSGNDVMDQLAGLAPGSALTELRRRRPDVVAHIEASDKAIFAPQDDGGLGVAERAALALRIAILLRDAGLERHYRARAEALPATTAARVADPRWQAMFAHVERVTVDPSSALSTHIEGLIDAGLSARAVIALSQLIAYVNFQARVLAGLNMLRGEG